MCQQKQNNVGWRFLLTFKKKFCSECDLICGFNLLQERDRERVLVIMTSHHLYTHTQTLDLQHPLSVLHFSFPEIPTAIPQTAALVNVWVWEESVEYEVSRFDSPEASGDGWWWRWWRTLLRVFKCVYSGTLLTWTWRRTRPLHASES